MRVFFKTFGCRVNQYETERLRERLLGDGVSVAVPDFETADVCVVNTCSVTDEADKDALQLLRRIHRRNPAARLIVTGCLATRAAERVRAAAPGAIIAGNAEKESLPELVLRPPAPSCAPEDGARGGRPRAGPAPAYAGLSSFSGHARAFVKVQDGCDMKCSYCVVPSVRPKLWSRPLPEVEAEARALIARGHRELVLCGIRLGRYLVAEGGKRTDLLGLLQRLAALEGDFRLRLSSLEITDCTDRFLDGYAALGERVCPSFHLPLQSGAETVLKRMGRWYGAVFYRRRLMALRERLPGAAVFTDLLTGFPGETDEEFDATRAFAEDAAFSGLHVFRFSARSGTPAAAMGGQVPAPELRRRAEALRRLDRSLRGAFAAAAVGSRRRVLVEESLPKVTAMTDHFLKVVLDRDPGPGLHWARVVSSSGPDASAVV
ncbi:MAG: MiaB/RimO family radical SAM methylthiotransferase [Elusimicrobiota bacterium]|jgi:threonylcarbamoyladenosine tRNA methylthiotransferase MtaB